MMQCSEHLGTTNLPLQLPSTRKCQKPPYTPRMVKRSWVLHKAQNLICSSEVTKQPMLSC